MFAGRLDHHVTEARDDAESGAARRRAMPPLTDYEGSLLMLVLRCQPATAYQLLKICARSPVSRCNESKGSLYPLVRRLTARGLLVSRDVAGDGRKARLLTCSEAGREAARLWAREIAPEQAFSDDGLLMRVNAFELLTAAERRIWVSAVRQIMTRKLAELEAYRTASPTPFSDLVHAGAMLGLLGRLEWLDLLSLRLDAGLPVRASPRSGNEGRNLAC